MDEGSKTRHKTTALDSVKTQILCNAELRQDFAKCVVLFKDYIYIMQTKVNKPQELNISSTVTKTETEQKKRKPQGKVEDKYYTIQEYKALSYEQKKKLKDLQAYRGHNLVEFWGLPPLIPLLQCVNRLGFEICSVNSCQSEQGSLVTLI